MHKDRAGRSEYALLAFLATLVALSVTLLAAQAITAQEVTIAGLITVDRISASIAVLVSGVGTVAYRFSLRYLDGAFNFDALAAGDLISQDFATRLVWFDAFVTNPDRTHRNPNLLFWQRSPWLIDHGAALYLQHGAADLPALAERPFPMIADHVLLPYAGSIAEAHSRLAGVAGGALAQAGEAVPAEWLPEGGVEPYLEYLRRRLEWGGFAEEAERARP